MTDIVSLLIDLDSDDFAQWLARFKANAPFLPAWPGMRHQDGQLLTATELETVNNVKAEDFWAVQRRLKELLRYSKEQGDIERRLGELQAEVAEAAKLRDPRITIAVEMAEREAERRFRADMTAAAGGNDEGETARDVRIAAYLASHGLTDEDLASCGLTHEPLAKPPSAIGERNSRTVPQAVKIAVTLRDQGKCVQCGATEDLHFDHKVPWSRGGTNTVNNIQLLCGPCNRRKGADDTPF